MSSITRILLLANSAKKHERCLAGIDLDTGSWIRPVSSKESGAVPTSKTIIEGTHLKPLDVIELRRSYHVPVPWQRENWLFEMDSLRRVRTVDMDDAYEALKQVSDLNASFVAASPTPVNHEFYSQCIFDYPSLALLAVPDFQIVPSRNHKDQWRNRINFRHGSLDWDLSLTDIRYPAWQNTGSEPISTAGGKAFICVSVGENLEGFDRHYKIAAGLISKSVKQ